MRDASRDDVVRLLLASWPAYLVSPKVAVRHACNGPHTRDRFGGRDTIRCDPGVELFARWIMKTCRIAALILAIVLAGCNKGDGSSPGAKESPAPAAGRMVKFLKHEVRDREGTGLVAATYLVPKDWAVQDHLSWEYRDCFNPIRYSAKLQSSDGAMKIEVFPDIAASWSMGPYGTQGVRPPANVKEALRQFVNSVRPGRKLKILSEKVIPGSSTPPTQMGGSMTQTNTAGGILHVQYQEKSRPVEEEFYATLTVVKVASQGVVYLESNVWTLSGLCSCTSPGRTLEDCRKFVLMIRSSTHLELPFYNRYVQVQKLLQDQAYARIYQAGQLSRIISQTNDQISQSISDSYWDRQRSNDRINEQFSDYVRGVDRYSDGSGTVTQLPSGYTNAWVNNRGEYLLTDQTGFNPNVEFNEDWKPLEKK